MFNIPQKFDGVSVLPAAEFNSLVDELKNIITSSGQALTGADVAQIAKAIANYVINGQYFTDSGVANAYLLNVVGAKFAPTAYNDGFTCMFKPGNTNTGAATVNIAGLGIKSIKKNNGADDVIAGDIPSGQLVQLVYNLGGDYFELFTTEFVAADFLRRDVTNNLTVGYTTTAFNIGNSGTGTITPSIANGHIQTLTINGNFTLAAPPESQSGIIEIQATVAAPGGFTINTAAFTTFENNYDSTSGKVNLIRIIKVGATSYLQINPVPKVSGATQTSQYNAILNAEMRVSQRNVANTYTSVADGVYTLDRYRYGKSGAVVHNIVQDTDTPSVTDASYLFTNSLLMTVTTADASIAAGDFSLIEQRIEGYRYAALAQKPMTLSFWVKSNITGIYCVSFRNSGQDRSYVAEYTINAANTWEKKTITVLASPSAGTWNYNNGIGLIVSWVLAAGTTFQTSAGSWNTGNFYATANQTNAVNAVSNTFRVTGIQLETGSSATPFLARGFNEELNDCQRYFEKSYNYSTPVGSFGVMGYKDWSSSAVQGAANVHTYEYQQNKRATPTVTVYAFLNGNTGQVTQINNTNVSIILSQFAEKQYSMNFTNTAGQYAAVHYNTVSAEL